MTCARISSHICVLNGASLTSEKRQGTLVGIMTRCCFTLFLHEDLAHNPRSNRCVHVCRKNREFSASTRSLLTSSCTRRRLPRPRPPPPTPRSPLLSFGGTARRTHLSTLAQRQRKQDRPRSGKYFETRSVLHSDTNLPPLPALCRWFHLSVWRKTRQPYQARKPRHQQQ